MIRPRVVTVLSSRSWEEAFVVHARQTGLVRIVGRAYRADEVARHRPDVAVVGFETAWLSADVVGLWAALGIRTVLVGSNEPQPDLGPLSCVGPSPGPIQAAIRDSWLAEPTRSEVMSIVGPHGSGTTELTCALVGELAPIHVIDRDEPSVALRLDLPPSGRDGIAITAGFPIDTPPQALVDCGTRGPLPEGRCVLVVAHTPVSLVRAAKLIVDWTGPVPDLVMNMTRDDRLASELAMRTLGLEPRLLLPYDPAVAEAAARGEAAPTWFRDEVARLLTGADDGQLR